MQEEAQMIGDSVGRGGGGKSPDLLPTFGDALMYCLKTLFVV